YLPYESLLQFTKPAIEEQSWLPGSSCPQVNWKSHAQQSSLQPQLREPVAVATGSCASLWPTCAPDATASCEDAAVLLRDASGAPGFVARTNPEMIRPWTRSA